MPNGADLRGAPHDAISAGALPENVNDLIDRIVAGYERQSKIIRGIGHDFKSPLASVSLMVDLLLSDELGPLSARQRAGLGAVAESITQLARLADALYAVAESRDGSLKLNVTRFDLVAVVADIAGALNIAAEVRGVALVQDGEAQLVIESDRGRVERVVSNLVQNAIKYSDGGTVRLSIADDGAWATVTVADEGIGIPSGEIDGITGPLVRGTNAAPGSGTGMGLAIVDQLVLDLQGTLRIESEFGKGTTIQVSIPAGDSSGTP